MIHFVPELYKHSLCFVFETVTVEGCQSTVSMKLASIHSNYYENISAAFCRRFLSCEKKRRAKGFASNYILFLFVLFNRDHVLVTRRMAHLHWPSNPFHRETVSISVAIGRTSFF